MTRSFNPAATQELVQAYHSANIDVVADLVARGANIDARLETGKTLLQAAVANRMEAMAFTLLANGADMNLLSEDDGYAPLHYAIQSNYTAMIDTLLTRGADPDIRGRSGITPLHIAAEETNLRNIKALLKHGADVAAEDVHGRTPRRVAEIRARESFSFAAQEYGRTADYLKPLEDARRAELDAIKAKQDMRKQAQSERDTLHKSHNPAQFRLKPPRK